MASITISLAFSVTVWTGSPSPANARTERCVQTLLLATTITSEQTNLRLYVLALSGPILCAVYESLRFVLFAFRSPHPTPSLALLSCAGITCPHKLRRPRLGELLGSARSGQLCFYKVLHRAGK